MKRGGPSGNPKLSALWILDANQAQKIIIQALYDNDGNVTHTSRSLGISLPTLKKWIREHGLQASLDEIRRKIR